MSWRRAVVILLSLNAACDDEPLPLDGRAFVLSDAQGFAPVTGSTVQLSFDGGELRASAGCNAMGGPYQMRDGSLVVPEIESTTKKCDVARGQQEQFIQQFLKSKPQLALDDDQLTLTGSSATLVFEEERMADAP